MGTTVRTAALSLLCLLFAGCELLRPSDRDLRTEPIGADLSDITDPRARWEAYQLSDYTILQTRVCECAGPYSYKAVARNGDVVELRNAKPRVEETSINLRWYLTVDEIFSMIEVERERGPARFEVSYHPRYGFPTDIFIDPDSMIADEEIIMTMSDVRRIVN